MKEIKGYEGLYSITSCGKVWSHKRKKFLTAHPSGTGYLFITLCKNGKKKERYIHILVAETYIPNPDNKPWVNHKKEFEIRNNCINNLEWATASENANYGTANKRRIANRQYTPIRCIETGEIFSTQDAAAKSIGKTAQSIRNCLYGKQKTAGGYHWERVLD